MRHHLNNLQVSTLDNAPSFSNRIKITLSHSALRQKVQTIFSIPALQGFSDLAFVHIPNDCLAILILFCWLRQLYRIALQNCLLLL